MIKWNQESILQDQCVIQGCLRSSGLSLLSSPKKRGNTQVCSDNDFVKIKIIRYLKVMSVESKSHHSQEKRETEQPYLPTS